MDESSSPRVGHGEDEPHPDVYLAADWLGVRIERSRFSVVLSAMSVVLIFAVVFVTFASIGQDFQPWHPCRVVVFRKSDGRSMVEYRYWSMVKAHDHLGDLSARLSTTDVATMSRDLGLDLSVVQTW